MNAKVIRLLQRTVEIVKREGLTYAIGGGVAVNAYGFERETKDVDAFFRDEDRLKVIRAFREGGFAIDDALSPFMYMAREPTERNARVRVDLMFPQGDPELSAVEMAADAKPSAEAIEEGIPPFKVFRVELLVLAKFYAGRPRDKLDIAQLLELGAFAPAAPLKLLEYIDPEIVPEYQALIASLSAPAAPKRRPRCKK